MSQVRVLIIDDNKDFVNSVSTSLGNEFEIKKAHSALEAREIFEPFRFDIILLDIRLNEKLKDKEGLEILTKIKNREQDLPVLIMTAYSDIDIAVESLKLGADDFIQKNKVNFEDYRLILKNIVEKEKLKKRVTRLEKKLEKFEPTEIIGEDSKIAEVKKLIKLVAEDGKVSVLIRGETGTGKELVARAIHREGVRKECPYVVVALASLNKETIASDLFGHEKGAYTGADTRRIGFIEEADKGIIFLDEIGELAPEVQIKLLRVLETKEFTRLGSNQRIKVDVQWVMATHRNLEKLVEEGKFRKDLYYRIKTFEIILSPLGERKDDISLLANYFLRLFKEEHRFLVKGFDKEVLKVFNDYSWPGNVRELRQAVEYGLLKAKLSGDKLIKVEHLPEEIGSGESKLEVGKLKFPADISRKLAEVELSYISQALKKVKKKTEVSKILGYKNRFALRRRTIAIFQKYPELEKTFPKVYYYFRKI